METMVKDLMQSPVRVVSKGDTIAHARNIFLRERISRLVVIDGSTPIGMLAKKDVVMGLSNYKMRARELGSISIQEVMRTPIKVINDDTLILDAARLMVSENIRGFPVVEEGGSLVGIITKTDLTRFFFENYLGKFKVGEVAAKKECVPILHGGHTALRAVDLMQEYLTDRIVVVDGEKPIGVITETDLSFLRNYRSGGGPYRGEAMHDDDLAPTRVYLLPIAEDIMTRDPFVVDLLSDAASAAGLLLDNGIGGMPVVDEHGDLAGMLTKFDFVKMIARGQTK
ncbi:MAG: CBS domain-containing protein [Desulfobacterales bacterium]|nr:CBS domain-containing protein [Desulfobacterales bacterium]